MPQASSYVLAWCTIKHVIAGIWIVGSGIMPSLDKHCLPSPVASYPAGRVMRIPIIYVISPFTGEVSDFGVELLYSPVFVRIGRMGEKDRVDFMAACLAVATGVTIRIRIFLCY